MESAAAILSRAKFSWICPLLAWASQAVAAVLPLKSMTSLLLVLAVVQLVLILTGLVFAIRVVSMGDAAGPEAKRHARMGLLISGGTIAVILLAIFLSVQGML